VSGKFYAGCKFGKDTNSETFMKPGGYHTSSENIKKVIDSEGLDSFIITTLLKEDEIGNVYEFETEFLRTNDIAKNPNWYNCHNNMFASFGTQEFKDMMMKIHGYENAWEIPGNLDRRTATNMERYGVEYVSQLPEIQEKTKNTNMERYGVTDARNTPENIAARIQKCKELFGSANNYAAIKATVFEKYGVENISQTQMHRDSFIATCQEKWGVDHYMQSEEYLEEYKKKLLETQGYENNFQRPDVVEKNRTATIERNKDPEYRKSQGEKIKLGLADVDRTGENNSFYGKKHTEESRAKMRESLKDRVIPKFTCLSCHKEMGVNNFTQHTRRCK
jgi:hypothetical protein